MVGRNAEGSENLSGHSALECWIEERARVGVKEEDARRLLRESGGPAGQLEREDQSLLVRLLEKGGRGVEWSFRTARKGLVGNRTPVQQVSDRLVDSADPTSLDDLLQAQGRTSR